MSAATRQLGAILLLTAMPAVHGGTLQAGQWPDTRTAGLIAVHADFDLGAYPDLLPEIVQLQQDLEQTLGLPAPQEEIHLYLFSTKHAYRHYLRQHFPNVNPRRAMFLKGRGPGMVFAYRSSELMIDVRHETTHALLHAVLPMVPLWLDEGLAEYFEVPREARARDNPHLARTKWAARFGSVPPLESLEAIDSLENMQAADYRQAWAVVHFALHGSPVARSELISYLADLHAQEVPGRFSERLRRRIPDIDQRMREHFRTW